MKKKIFFSGVFSIAFVLLIIMACSLPGIKADHRSQTIVTHSSAFIGYNAADMEALLFPRWWVLSAHAARGGSPLAVVFSPDGGVYTRTQANIALHKTGSWQYNQATGVFTIADIAGANIGSSHEGKWDGAIYLSDEALVAGRQDYQASDIPRQIEFNNAVYFDKGNKENIACLLVRFTGGVIHLGAGTFVRNAEYAANKTRITVSWAISPLGDEIIFSGENAQAFRIYYAGKSRMMSIKYEEPVYIDLDSPTKQFFADGGVQAVGRI